MVTFKEYIEKEYPNFRERENVENLSIAGKNLEGEMNFAGLGFNNLKTIDCWGNRFAGINFDALNANKLTFFDIGENGIKFDINLSYFSRFPNLNTLVLHSNPGAVGNLESLKDLKKLEYFKIHNTNIEGNIESLPTSIKGFQYYGSKVNDPISLTYSYGTDVVGNKLLDYKKQRVISKLNLTGKKKIKIENATRDNFEEILAEILIEENGEDKLVEIQLPLKDIPSKYWDKVEVDNNWDREYQVDASIELPIMVNQVGGNPWDKKFKSQEILDKFKIFTNPNDKFFGRTGHAEETHNPPWTIKDIDADTYYFIHTPSKISNLIKGGGKVLKESNRLQSKESFEFLQSIIDSKESVAIIKLNREVSEKENKEFKSKINQLLGLKETDELPANWKELLIKKVDKSQKEQEFQEELNKKQVEKQELEKRIVFLEVTRKELKKQLRGLEDQLEETTDGREELQKQLDQTKTKLTNCEKDLKEVKKGKEELITQIDQLQNTLKNIENSKNEETDKYRLQLTESLTKQKKLEEKVRKLENSERDFEQVKNLKENIDSLTKQLEETKSELAFLKITGSLSESKDKEMSEMANELSDSGRRLEKAKSEKNKLEDEITNKEEKKKNLENEGKTNSEEYRKLLAEIENLREKLASADRETEKLRKQVDNLKEQLNTSYLSLQEEIEEKKESLKNKREACENEIAKKWSIKDSLRTKLGDRSYIEKIVTLLQAQEEITRDNNDKFAATEKEKIIKSLSEFSEELQSLCILQEELTRLEMKLKDIEKAGQAFKTVLIAPVIPPHLRNKESDIEDRSDIKSISYDKIFSEVRKLTLQKNCKTEKLPTRLYNIKENKVVETKNDTDISNYAILSYVWGGNGDLPEEAKGELDNIWNSIGYKNELNPSGYKSWKKAIETCKLLGIDYLWIDQLCTNQGDNEDKNREVPKMRQYYFNSAVTLISINRNLSDEEVTEKGVESEKVLEKVIRSKWFTRSWTFQEGWLSKHAIFMFDSHLIDGSLLANRWVLGQPSYVGSASYRNILDEGSQKIATPLGWAYYKEGYNEEDRISFTLNQALRAIKNRGRGVSIDGIYSILGLLSYGDKVKVEYKKWGERYEKKDLEKALFNVVLTAMKESGYNEYFAWHGTGNNWLPEAYEEDDSGYPRKTKGGTSIEGGISIIRKEFEEISSASEIEVTVVKYKIKEVHDGLSRKEEKDRGSIIDSGACVRSISVISDDDRVKAEIKLLGTNEILEKNIKEQDKLLLLSEREWRSNKPFALVVRKDKGTYQRIGLVEISENDREKLQKVGKEEKLMIKIDKLNMSIEVTENSEQQAQIQADLKGNN